MEAKIKWVEDAMFLAESGSGHALVVEGPPDAGGLNRGVRPMELMLMGLGSCAAFDVVHILKKGRHDVRSCVAELRAQRADNEPKVFTEIEMVFKVSGHELKPQAVERAVHLSAEKYCSASIMLGRAGVELKHSYEIIDA